MSTIFKVESRVELDAITLDYEKRACQVPRAYEQLIREIVQQHNLSRGIALGNLELCYRRTLAHAEELRKQEEA